MAILNIGLIGLGFVTEWHIHAFRADPRSQVAGLARDFYGSDEAQQRQRLELEIAAQSYGVKAYPSPQALIDDPAIDAVVVGSINSQHLPQIRRAIEQGKPLLVEKPMLTELAAYDEIVDQTNAGNVLLFPGHNFLYQGAVQKARALLNENRLGRLLHGSLAVTHTISAGHANGWRGKRALAAGGALMDSGHHLVYQSIYLLGRPTQVQAFTSRQVLTQMDCEDTAQVSLCYPSGVMGVILQSWASGHGEGINGIRFLGDQGNLVLTDALYLNGEKVDTNLGYGASFDNQAKAFVDYVTRGVPPLSTVADARTTLEITLAAYQSAATDRVVRLAAPGPEDSVGELC